MQSRQRIVAKAMHAIIHVLRLVEFVTGCTNQKPRGAFQGKTVTLASLDLMFSKKSFVSWRRDRNP
jgi:hypothetical protein